MSTTYRSVSRPSSATPPPASETGRTLRVRPVRSVLRDKPWVVPEGLTSAQAHHGRPSRHIFRHCPSSAQSVTARRWVTSTISTTRSSPSGARPPRESSEFSSSRQGPLRTARWCPWDLPKGACRGHYRRGAQFNGLTPPPASAWVRRTLGFPQERGGLPIPPPRGGRRMPRGVAAHHGSRGSSRARTVADRTLP